MVGIDDYPSPNELSGCVNDAIKLTSLLESNGDGSPNFDVRKIVSSEVNVTAELLSDAVAELFSGDAETVILYFAGHGILNETTNNGFLVTQDGKAPHWGGVSTWWIFFSKRTRRTQGSNPRSSCLIAANRVLQGRSLA